MRIRLDKWLVVVSVIALSTLSWWMPLDLEPGSVATLVTPEKRHVPDFYLGDFDLTTMREDGSPRYRLTGEDMRHFSDDDTSLVIKPAMIVYREEAAPWQVWAGQAQVAAAGESVLLLDKVKAQHQDAIDRGQLQLLTELLKVWPDREYAETDQPVTILSDLGVTRAVGMEVDLKTEQLRLLAEVRSDYARR